jgi:hypothetical protein
MNNTKGSSSILLKSSSKNSLSVKNFGSKVFNELLISSWMQTKVSERMSCQQFKVCNCLHFQIWSIELDGTYLGIFQID